MSETIDTSIRDEDIRAPDDSDLPEQIKGRAVVEEVDGRPIVYNKSFIEHHIEHEWYAREYPNGTTWVTCHGCGAVDLDRDPSGL